jgi:hypothetical protein
MAAPECFFFEFAVSSAQTNVNAEGVARQTPPIAGKMLRPRVTALLCKRNLGQCMKFSSYAISQRDDKELLRQSF